MACVQALDLGRAACCALPHAFSCFGQRREVGVRFGELLARTAAPASAAACSLRRISSILRARGLELLLGGEPRLVGGAQLGAERFLPVARRRQRLLRLAARRRAALQRFLDRRPVDRRALGRELREQRLLLRDLRGERLAAARRARRGGRGSCARRTPPPARRARRARTRSRPRAWATSASLRACRAASRLRHLVVQPRLRVGELGVDRARAPRCSAHPRAAISASSSAICARRCSAASAACRNCSSSSSRSWQRRCCDANGEALGVICLLRAPAARASTASRARRAPRPRRRARCADRVRRARPARAGARARRAARCPARRS